MGFVRRAIAPARSGPAGAKAWDGEDWPWSAPPPDWLRGIASGATSTAVGLPPLLGALFTTSMSLGMTTPMVYDDRGDRKRATTKDPEYSLLHDDPTRLGGGAFPFYSDGTMSLAAAGNAYIRKWKANGRVAALEVLDAREWCARRSGGEIVFDNKRNLNGPSLTRNEVLHLRLPAINGGTEGVAPITQLRMTVEQGIARNRSVSKMWQNDSWLGLVYKTPQEMTEEQSDTWWERWQERHSGPENAGRPTILHSSTDLSRIPLSLQDLQFVEAYRVDREMISAVYRIPVRRLGDSTATVDPSDEMWFLRFGLGPYYKAWDDGINADPDIMRPGFKFEFLADSLNRPSTKDRYESYVKARQGGWVTPNELRGWENLEPKEGGDELLQTPVGAAPNTPTDTPSTEDVTPPVNPAANGKQLPPWEKLTAAEQDQWRQRFEEVFA